MKWLRRAKARLYLDAAAGLSANPSSPHEEGRAAKEMLENARIQIARLVEAQADDVVFVSGATEANALAILGTVRGRQKTENGKAHALYLPTAHASIVENMKLAQEEGAKVEPLPLREGRIDIEAMKDLLRPHTAVVAMEAVCGETGTVWNTREVRNLLDMKGEKRPLLHVDASQAPLTQKITRAHFGADLLALDASKVSGARGIGALVAHRTIPLAPLYGGGGQERGLRSGSEAPLLAEAFAAALGKRASEREAFHAHSERIRRVFLDAVKGIPRLHIYEAPVQDPHIINLSLPGRDTDYLVALMDEAGVAISTRSACETDSEAGSRAVLALTGDPERARATLRFSWGPGMSEKNAMAAGKALVEAVRFVDAHAAR